MGRVCIGCFGEWGSGVMLCCKVGLCVYVLVWILFLLVKSIGLSVVEVWVWYLCEGLGIDCKRWCLLDDFLFMIWFMNVLFIYVFEVVN